MRLACIAARTVVVATDVQVFDVYALFPVVGDVDRQLSAVEVPADDTFSCIFLPVRNQVVDGHRVLTIQVVVDDLTDVVGLVVIVDVYVVHDGTIHVDLQAAALLLLFLFWLLLGAVYQELVVGGAVVRLENQQGEVVDLDRPQSHFSCQQGAQSQVCPDLLDLHHVALLLVFHGHAIDTGMLGQQVQTDMVYLDFRVQLLRQGILGQTDQLVFHIAAVGNR